MRDDALAVEAAGASAVVLECVPAPLAAEISLRLKIPTIGIGGGVACDGQVLVMHDMLGFSSGSVPKFVREYLALGEIVTKAAALYVEDVRLQKFPGDHESY